MKKKTFNKKLKLNKETISNLNKDELSKIKGGYPAPSRLCPINTRSGYPCYAC